MGFRLAVVIQGHRSWCQIGSGTKIDDLELYKFEFSENFAGFRRFRADQLLNE